MKCYKHIFLIEQKTKYIFYIYTPAVERAVKTVTEASGTLCSIKAHEGIIESKNESRKHMPKLEIKDFKTV